MGEKKVLDSLVPLSRFFLSSSVHLKRHPLSSARCRLFPSHTLDSNLTESVSIITPTSTSTLTPSHNPLTHLLHLCVLAVTVAFGSCASCQSQKCPRSDISPTPVPYDLPSTPEASLLVPRYTKTVTAEDTTGISSQLFSSYRKPPCQTLQNSV